MFGFEKEIPVRNNKLVIFGDSAQLQQTHLISCCSNSHFTHPALLIQHKQLITGTSLQNVSGGTAGLVGWSGELSA
jgi:hypothetical protein